jgi:hypothetical protein
VTANSAGRPQDGWATPEAAQTIKWLEEVVTGWFAGTEVSLYDVVGAAVSLAGLTLTVGMDDNVACIQEI